METTYTCPHCGGINIQRLVWVNLNDESDAKETDGSDMYFCVDCDREMHTVNETETK